MRSDEFETEFETECWLSSELVYHPNQMCVSKTHTVFQCAGPPKPENGRAVLVATLPVEDGVFLVSSRCCGTVQVGTLTHGDEIKPPNYLVKTITKVSQRR